MKCLPISCLFLLSIGETEVFCASQRWVHAPTKLYVIDANNNDNSVPHSVVSGGCTSIGAQLGHWTLKKIVVTQLLTPTHYMSTSPIVRARRPPVRCARQLVKQQILVAPVLMYTAFCVEARLAATVPIESVWILSLPGASFQCTWGIGATSLFVSPASHSYTDALTRPPVPQLLCVRPI